MHKKSGFTLIELVVVILVLGIIAVIAAPRFLNLQTDARISTLQGVKGAINSANQKVYGKAVIKGEETTQEWRFPEFDAGKVQLRYGYIAATGDALKFFVTLDNEVGIQKKDNVDEARVIRLFIADYGEKNCYLDYQEALSNGEQPVITEEYSDC
ncbi:MSHA pilin protein mshA [Vibrio ishigakensis]|uniref:MSHA pilin protein mshA n=1 Tax=Vibrio ishigakensis TaxID=1481914 RepID=A0A0B8QNM8_9VIBR|nr:MSHA pilin protein mshA [Vibrio ishigakensis]